MGVLPLFLSFIYSSVDEHRFFGFFFIVLVYLFKWVLVAIEISSKWSISSNTDIRVVYLVIVAWSSQTFINIAIPIIDATCLKRIRQIINLVHFIEIGITPTHRTVLSPLVHPLICFLRSKFFDPLMLENLSHANPLCWIFV